MQNQQDQFDKSQLMEFLDLVRREDWLLPKLLASQDGQHRV
jgi:hypothetical protein